MTSDAERSVRSRWLLGILVAACLPYAQTLGHGFTWDDQYVVVENRLIRSVGSTAELVTSAEWVGAGEDYRVYRPLTGVTYLLNHAVGGLDPLGYHAVNVLLHGGTAALLFLLVLAWGAPAVAAGIAAILFALHPIHVEAVANVVGRKDVLATLFLLLQALAHRHAVNGGVGRVALAVGAYAAAMLSKEIGVVGVALVAAQDLLLPGARPARREVRWALYGGYAVALAAYLLAYRGAVGGFGAPDGTQFVDNPLAHVSFPVRLLSAVAVVWKGIALQFLPVGQSPDYSFEAIPLAETVTDARVWAALLILGGWGWISVRRWRTEPSLALSLGWYVLPLAPVSNLAFPVGTLFGDRLLYASSAGLAVAVAIGAHALMARRPRALAAAVALVGLALAGLTFRYAAAWRDNATLLQWAATATPRSARVQLMVAERAIEEARPADALRHANAAIAILPTLHGPRTIAGLALHALGRDAEAMAMLKDELERTPRFAKALYAAGVLLRDAGDLAGAAGYWRRALDEKPRYAAALTDLGAYHLVTGDTPRAEELLRAAVDADPLFASGWYNLSLARRLRGDPAGEREASLRFLQTAGSTYAAEAARVRAAMGEPRTQ